MKTLCMLAAACALMLGSAVAQQYPQNPAPSNGNEQYPAPVPQAQQPPVNTTGAPFAQIPAGTNLSIRTNDQIVADKNSTGRAYSGEISQDVLGPNGQILLPRGTPAMLTVVQVSNGTLGVGSNQVALALQSVNLNGRTYQVMAANNTQAGNGGIGANKRTAEMTGGGALLGTILGAAIGGGKGAAIGAVIGAGGGATAQVLTRGSEVKVPAETVLTFKLDQPLVLQ